MSGFTDDAVVHHGVVADGTCFIQKPFSPGALALKVREVLDYPRGENASLGNDQLAHVPGSSNDLEKVNHGYNPIN